MKSTVSIRAPARGATFGFYFFTNRAGFNSRSREGSDFTSPSFGFFS